ncbi:MAG: spore coat protein CotH [Clostridiales bacterium]|nr:spore coat protein CotH [Clostridiales bacterium]
MKKLILRAFAALLLLVTLCVPALAEEPEITLSLASGFYDAPVTLEITGAGKDAQIYYTTDGSIPDETDLHYEGGVFLDLTTGKPDPLTMITDISAGDPFVPQKDFPSAHIIRAVAILPDGTRSAIVSGTYFVGYDRQELYGDTALMFLAIDPSHLFDYETGIYVNGRYFDEWDSQQTEPYETWQAQGNYSQRGDEWERPVTVTFLPSEGEGFTQDMGVRIKGGVSRTNNQKSLRLIAREEYGAKNVKFPVFPGNPRETDGEELAKYKSFTLRNGGNDCDFGKIRDPYISRLAEGMRFETAANMPVIAFINGEYWGLYTLNEEYSDNYFDYHYGIDNKNIISVKVGSLQEGEEEDIEYFDEMFNYIISHDMTDPAAYFKAGLLLDLESFADYSAVQFYISNYDGPFHNNNWQMWRVREPGKDDSPYADGKWRMMLYDTDYSSGIYDGGSTFHEDTLSPVLTGRDYEGSHPALLFNALMRNDDFFHMFLMSACDVRNLYFQTSRVNSLLDEMTGWYLPYQPDTLLRFGPQWVSWDPAGHFSNNLNSIRTFFRGRYTTFIDIVRRACNLTNPVTISIRASGGQIVINGRDEAPVANNAALRYFSIAPITVTAVPDEGKRFVRWELSDKSASLDDPTAETTTFTFSRNVKLTAVFE